LAPQPVHDRFDIGSPLVGTGVHSYNPLSNSTLGRPQCVICK
jgi:hypothetical protein